MYQQYKDVAGFRVVYINEAHPADGHSPVEYAKQLGITKHQDYGQRCTTAQMLVDDKKLTVPCLIDGMDNAVNRSYRAWPDRIYLVRTDGRLAVVASRGPWGFEPALAACSQWLSQLKKTGKEPPLH